MTKCTFLPVPDLRGGVFAGGVIVSIIATAKLLVPAGSPDHIMAGDWFEVFDIAGVNTGPPANFMVSSMPRTMMENAPVDGPPSAAGGTAPSALAGPPSAFPPPLPPEPP